MTRKTRKGMRTMEIFGKRIGYRLTGGVATILLGAFAAAQAQRSELPDDTQLAEASAPALDVPSWQSEMLAPIAAPQFDSSSDPTPTNEPSVIQQVGFDDETFVSQPVDMASHSESVSDPGAGPSSFSMPEPGSQPEANVADAPAPMTFGMPPMDAPADGNEPTTGGQPMAMPEADLSMPGGFEMPDMSMTMSTPAPMEATAPINEGPSADMPATDQGGPGMLGSFGEASAPSMPAAPVPGPATDAAAMTDVPVNDMRSGNALRMGDAPNMSAMPEPVGMPSAQNQENSFADQPLPNLPAPGFSNDSAPANRADYGPAADHGFGADPNQPNAFESPNQFAGMPEPTGPTSRRGAPAMNDLRSAPADMQFGANDSMNAPSAYGTPEPSSPHPAAQDLSTPNPSAPNQLPTRFASQRGLPAPGFAMGGADAGTQAQSTAFAMPGERRLEGMQTPSIVIHKEAPPEVKVGQPATFRLNVQNVGTAEAMGVRVHDTIPAGMRFNDASGNPVMQGDALMWELGNLPAGEQRVITMNLTPIEEGELGSIARVTFEAAASVRTRSTRPELKVVQHAPTQVLIGQQLEIELEVSNVGSGAATNVVLREDVPQGMDHPGGRELDSYLNTLRPGEVRHEVLRMRATAPGVIRNTVQLVSDDAEPTQHTVEVEVVAPEIDIRLTGPGRRFLERQATYEVELLNRGTAPATNVEIIARLDRGFTFVSTENAGYYDPNRHAVLWSLASLPPGKPAKVPLTLLPVEEGEQAIQLEASADLDTRATSENTVRVESQAELTFAISDLADPIEQGAETTYEIRVQNTGSRNDSNVQVRLMVPRGMEVVGADADVRPDGQGGMMFAPENELPAGSELTYRIRVRGLAAETHVVKAIVTSDQSPKPVTKEESTMVYADR
nr:hypothetical protein [Rhodopirellula sp. JC737]